MRFLLLGLTLLGHSSWAKSINKNNAEELTCPRLTTALQREQFIMSQAPENNPIWARVVLDWVTEDANHFWKTSEARGFIPTAELFTENNVKACFDAEEAETLSKKALHKGALDLAAPNGPQRALRSYSMLAPLIKYWSIEDRMNITEDLSRALRDQFIKEKPGQNGSKVFYQIENRLLQALDPARPNLSDVAVERLDKKDYPILARLNFYSNGDLKITDYPIYTSIPPAKVEHRFQEYFSVQQLALKFLDNRTVSWTTNGKNYKLTVQSHKLGDGIIRTAEKPRFEELWHDKKLTGVLLLSSNLNSPIEQDLQEVQEEYENYYKEQKFTFTELEPTSSLEYLHKLVASGEADYMIKEAHSRGDDENLVELPTLVTPHVGVLPFKGHKEVIHILAPAKSSDDSVHIKNQTFGNWFKEREKVPEAGELVYLNMSCSSSTKACNEFTAVRSPLFSVIYSISSVNWFKNRPDWPPYELIHGFRMGYGYEQIRTNIRTSMAKANERRETPMPNRYVFPHQPEYKETLGGRVMDVEVFIQRQIAKDAWKNVPNLIDDR